MSGKKKPVEVEDLYRHKSITKLNGATAHQTLVLAVSRVLREADANRTALWRWQADTGVLSRLTDPAFNASGPVLDPGGERVAFLATRKGDAQQVHVMPLDGGEASALTTSTHELDAIHGWSPDGARLLVTAAVRWEDDLGGARDDDASCDADRPKVARFLPYKQDGSGIVLGRRTHLFAADTQDGALTPLVEGDFEVDEAAWSPDGRRLCFVRGRDGRQRHRNDLWLADADGGNPRQLTDNLASIKQVAWSPDGRRIAIAAGEEEGDAATGLWLLDVAGGGLRRVGDKDFELHAPAELHWHPDGRRLAAIAMRRGLQQVAVLDMTGDDPGPAYLDAGLRHALALAPCGDSLAVVFASMRNPEELHTIDWDGGGLERRTSFNRRWVARRQRPHASKRRFRVPDGNGGEERVDGWLLRPDGDGPFPLLVDLHGGPHSDVLVNFPAHVYQYVLVSRGWMVLAPNTVGSSGYGREFRERLRGHWGELDLPQVLAMVATLQDAGLADARVACAGKSYGGFLSAWAVGHCDVFRAAVVSAPVADIESHAGTSDSGYYVTPRMIGGELTERRERYLRLSPTTYCADVRTPTLVLQGEDDQRCPIGQSEEFFAGLVRCSPADAEMVVYPGGNHSMAASGKPSHRVDYHRRVVDWIERAGKEKPRAGGATRCRDSGPARKPARNRWHGLKDFVG